MLGQRRFGKIQMGVVVVIALVMGANLISPAVGHVTRSLRHLTKHLDKRYYNVGEKVGSAVRADTATTATTATNATTATTATNANNLGNNPPGYYLPKLFASVNGTCNGFEVQNGATGANQDFAARCDVRFNVNIATQCTPVASWTDPTTGEITAVTDRSAVHAGLDPNEVGVVMYNSDGSFKTTGSRPFNLGVFCSGTAPRVLPRDTEPTGDLNPAGAVE